MDDLFGTGIDIQERKRMILGLASHNFVQNFGRSLQDTKGA